MRRYPSVDSLLSPCIDLCKFEEAVSIKLQRILEVVHVVVTGSGGKANACSDRQREAIVESKWLLRNCTLAIHCIA